jgi:DNA-formamidopyrimidine glycosylase
MPEGHTLRRLADELTSVFGGRRVRVSSPQGRFAAQAAALDGALLVEADSRGKHLFVEFEGERFVHIHLGLIGHFDVHENVHEVPAPVGQVRLRLVVGGDQRTSYADLRGATQCELVTLAEKVLIETKLGADPLRENADVERAWNRIARSSRPIGELLMDQTVVSGVGNVYRAEVLFRQRIDPLRPGQTLRRRQFQTLWEDLVALMGEGVRTGRIDTVRPEHTPEAMGRPARVDDHGGEVYVYRRAGQFCLVCGARVRTQVLAGRNLFWCGQCQRRFRSRAVQ